MSRTQYHRPRFDRRSQGRGTASSMTTTFSARPPRRPVPAPPSLVLVLSGAGSLLGCAWLRRRGSEAGRSRSPSGGVGLPSPAETRP
jgi:hypothetical protein